MTINDLLKIISKCFWDEEIRIHCNGEAGDFPIASVQVDCSTDIKILIVHESE